MRKTLFILIAVFCLVGIIFFFITWKSCPTEKNKDGFDFVENFFKAEMNYTMTAEEMDSILSTCSATTVCS
ncbi:MAG: hypothetical protein JW737_00730, partial [Acidobacteria bacterium]|nr:hypothetical protein [Acidobacteriota bacterium]